MSHQVPSPLVIWCLLDGKPGHQNQSLGLAEAIARQVASTIVEVPLCARTAGWRGLVTFNSQRYRSQPPPDLILGAGHRTHLPLLALRKRFAARSIVLMRPSLPACCFDLCLIPEADQALGSAANAIATRGVLNRVVPAEDHHRQGGLILIGGPSKHYQWSDQQVFDQVQGVLQRRAEIPWQIGTSRRTPASFLSLCRGVCNQATIVTPDDVPAEWLLAQYRRAESIWVTEDSVSMTYEAVTSGSRVGLLELSAYRSNRVTRSIDALVDSADVTRYRDWNHRLPLAKRGTALAEADRCATQVVSTLLGLNQPRIRAA